MEIPDEGTKKGPKPPRVFVTEVENINPLMALLDEEITGKYSIKDSTEEVKIQDDDGQTYSKIKKALNEKNTQYHTYKTK
ncbi:unnamed protein product [Diabrotica balteata]|uniref:Uncharacterized protein n=1 Tax=Diabrotica balteata TaxID=107213 RepID=A0A9N9X742_DIABA|nr:unnamed protein product [Diabrotica balteata]